MPGKVPLYREDRGATAAGSRSRPTRPCCEADGAQRDRRPGLRRDHRGGARRSFAADVVFFDGTLFTDDEMIAAGLGAKTGRRMGHVPISGPGGTLDRLA